MKNHNDQTVVTEALEALNERVVALEVQAQERHEISVVAVKAIKSFATCFDIEVEGLTELAERYLRDSCN